MENKGYVEIICCLRRSVVAVWFYMFGCSVFIFERVRFFYKCIFVFCLV